MGELERIGDSDWFGWMLLELLERNGWTIVQRPALGSGLLLIATNAELGAEVVVEACSVNDAAPKLVERCSLEHQMLGSRASVQLTIEGGQS